MLTKAIPPVLLILGGGPNIGYGVARAFTAKGYKVALTSRTSRNNSKGEDYLYIQSDLSEPDAVASVFEKVREALGPPSVVVYNAAAATLPTEKDDPLSLSVTSLTRDIAVNTTSVLSAAHHATISFGQLPTSASRTFIYTGNRLNIAPIPPLLSLGMGKSATAHMIALASQVYKDKGWKFYYADERKSDGSPAFSAIDGEAHGRFYVQLAEDERQGPWLATFVKDSGYVDFSGS